MNLTVPWRYSTLLRFESEGCRWVLGSHRFVRWLRGSTEQTKMWVCFVEYQSSVLVLCLALFGSTHQRCSLHCSHRIQIDFLRELQRWPFVWTEDWRELNEEWKVLHSNITMSLLDPVSHHIPRKCLECRPLEVSGFGSRWLALSYRTAQSKISLHFEAAMNHKKSSQGPSVLEFQMPQ
jgi:hypothetical protein